MKIINSIINIPKFIKEYIIKDDSYYWLEIASHSISNKLLNLKFEINESNDGFIKLISNAAEKDENLLKFLNFYFSKIRLDRKGYCPYEEELNIPESVSNETFKVIIDDKEENIFIDSFEDDKLVIIVLK